MKLLFVGDIVFDSNISIKISKKLSDYFANFDYRICNFEEPILANNPTKIIKAGPYVYNSENTVDFLVKNNINIAALANNHIMDYGKESLQHTIETLHKNNIQTIGADITFHNIYKPLVLNDKTEKICIINCAQAEFGVCKDENCKVGYAWVNSPIIQEMILSHKVNNEKIIIFAHCGMENQVIPLPEWKQIYHNFAHLLSKGDYIIATHPHIVQGYEIYNDVPIYYSLGNFIFQKKGFTDSYESTRSLLISIDTKQDKSEALPIKLSNKELDFDTSEQFNKEIVKRSDYITNDNLLNTMANEIAQNTWEQFYKYYYSNLNQSNIQNINDMSLLQIIKYCIKKLLRMNKKNINNSFNETMLLHNIQIETHRFIVERFLYNQNIKNNNFI